MEQEKNTERSISAGMRILLVALALVGHLLLVGLLSDILEQYFAYAYAAMEVAALICAVRIYNRRGSPSYKILWILLVRYGVGMLFALQDTRAAQKRENQAAPSARSVGESAHTERK